MKKNLISLAVAASVLGGAAVQAGQHVNQDGTGQVLMFPFYNADNSNTTAIHIVNTTDDAKALKVRFLEYKNSDEVLDFHLYLSPRDHFAFGVIKNPNGDGAAIITQDNSCTVPALGTSNPPLSGTSTTEANGAITRIQPFTNYLYAAPPTPDVDSSLERTLTGHVEVIEMGKLENVGTPSVTNPAPAATQWEDFVTHGADGVPSNCAGMITGWAKAGLTAAQGGMTASSVSAPTGGLYGLAYHINVASAASFGFEATAIDDFRTGQQAHNQPGDDKPAIWEGQAAITLKTDDALIYESVTLSGGANAAEDQAQAIGAILTTNTLSNDIMVNSAIGGMTDWVVTFPTKKAHVSDVGTDVVAPFTKPWFGIADGPTPGSYVEVKACEGLTINQWDREEAGFTGSGPGFSPSILEATDKLCNEVAVIAMGPAGTASALNVTTGLTNYPATFAEGWQKYTFAQTMTNGKLTTTGLPAIGFAAYKVANGAMSYGNASEHKLASANVIS